VTIPPAIWRSVQHFRPLWGAMRDLTPIVVVIVFFQEIVFQKPIPNLGDILMGLMFVLLGLALFVRGLEIGLFPLGESMAHAFAKKGNVFWLLMFSFLLGFGTTIAEPPLIAVAAKAADIAAAGNLIANTTEAMQAYADALRYTVALSVGTAIVLGVLRILFGWPLHICILGGYLLVMVMTMIAPAAIIGIAYDAGGVTTSTITVPLVTALGVGLASSIRGRNPVLDGFGLIAFASLLPIIFVMVFGMIRLGVG